MRTDTKILLGLLISLVVFTITLVSVTIYEESHKGKPSTPIHSDTTYYEEVQRRMFAIPVYVTHTDARQEVIQIYTNKPHLELYIKNHSLYSDDRIIDTGVVRISVY